MPMTLPEIINKHENELITEWTKELKNEGSSRESRISESELFSQIRELLTLLKQAPAGEVVNSHDPVWDPLRNFLADISRSRVSQGFSSDETATFIFSFKKPLFQRLQTELVSDPKAFADAMWKATQLLDMLGLMTVRAYQKTREDVINRQQSEMLELSTPVVKLWEGVLALPMIGTLDSARTQIVMESLLQRIVDTGSEIAIIDITGVPTVDTLVAQHLLKTVTAIRLMGADCIISGVRPQIAQTIVHLGVDLQGVTTKATLADALSVALKRSGFSVSKISSAQRN
jgi:rsbT co-antagonist protein RsbR